jgi:sec-independent protein translocase protein TatB
MEIFGVGPWELIIVLMIAFVVLGPDKIPEVARTLGRLVRQLRNMSNELTGEFGDEFKEVKSEITSVQREFRAMQRDLGDAARSVVTQVNDPKPNNPGGPATVRPPTINPPEPAAPPPPAATSDQTGEPAPDQAAQPTQESDQAHE